MVQAYTSGLQHTELQHTLIQKDEEAVSAVISLIQSRINPFAGSQDLGSISTATAYPRDIALDSMKAYEIGEKGYTTFKKGRLEHEHPVRKFHDPS